MSDEKLEKAVYKIFRMTHEGALNWAPKTAPRIWQQATDSAYPVYFETEYQGRKLALYQERSRKGEAAWHAARVLDQAFSEWTQSAHLALLGDNDEVLFEFPWSRQTQDLFDAVRYKVANVDEFLDELLKSDSVDVKQ